MGKTAFLFSGQGSQYMGMGSELCHNFAEARHIYELASDTLGFDVLKLSCEGSKEELSQTAISQPLIYTLSIAAYEVAAANGLLPDAVAGFSLGECSAFTAAKVMDHQTGFQVIRERAKAMQQAAESTGGTMFAVIGRQPQEIEEACSQAGGYVVPVNYNCPGQIVIAGVSEAAEKAAGILADGGARVVKLSVNAAFHSKLMAGASDKFYETIRTYSFFEPVFAVYSNLTGGLAPIKDPASYLKEQMISPVRFIDEMNAMSADGIDTFVELGPGKTLCGFIRKGIKGAKFFNIEDLSSFEKCLNALKQ